MLSEMRAVNGEGCLQRRLCNGGLADVVAW